MPILSRRTILTLACGLLALHPAAAQTRAPFDDMALAAALRGGGLVILIRHGATFTDQADSDPVDFDNISAQRNLNDDGKALARSFGEALRQAGIPVGRVYTSKFNRAYETATLAGFCDIEKSAHLTDGGSGVTPGEKTRRTEALRKLLATPPAPGTNTFLVTHRPNIIDALGEAWLDVNEGEATIFRPANGTFILVARLQMADWPRIGGAMDR